VESGRKDIAIRIKVRVDKDRVDEDRVVTRRTTGVR
jgi:hypothetical protein